MTTGRYNEAVPGAWRVGSIMLQFTRVARLPDNGTEEMGRS